MLDLARLQLIHDRLATAYGEPVLHPNGDPLGELIQTILSQHTSDVNSQRAYHSLIAQFPTWQSVRDADPTQLAESIRSGGLAETKAARIQAVLGNLTERLPEGEIDDRFAEWLNGLPLPEAKSVLRALPGVGPKTAACVLLFALGRPAMPVDTHVFRVSQRLAILPPHITVTRAHDMYDATLPAAMVYPLHILLIWHGRRVCHAQRPACDRCPLLDLCPWGQSHLIKG